MFERRMKKWNRDWKIARIEERNQAWQDLSHALL
ncbi:putative GIY-YIG superfamily endonuclease [Altererythrobacter atlanticus]|nr:putative GIY-YIG superfamily endonuclease [Croceibacterium atlanticum]